MYLEDKNCISLSRRGLLIGSSIAGASITISAFAKDLSKTDFLDSSIIKKGNYICIDGQDNRFETLKKGFNLRWPNKDGASYIYVCKTEQDVVAAVNHAHSNGLRITVRSGGHCYEGFVSNKTIPNDDKSIQQELAIIDLGMMNGMEYAADQSISSLYDDAKIKYCLKIASGSQNWDSYVRLYKSAGKTIPGGSCYSVGLGGHITGGGYGLLSRKHGLTVDWLAGIDILIPTIDENSQKTIGFQLKHISRSSSTKSDIDLFVACCGGGGGNFGIVINYYFETLPDAPQKALFISLTYKWSDIKNEANLHKFLTAYWKWFSDNDADWNNSDPKKENGGLFALLKLNHINSGDVQLLVQYTGQDGTITDNNIVPFISFVKTMNDASDGKLINISDENINPKAHDTSLNKDKTRLSILSKCREMDWLYLTQSINGSGENLYGKYKSVYQKGEFTKKSTKALFQYLSDTKKIHPTAALVQIDSYGGRINANKKVDQRNTSVYQRESLLKWQFQIYWTDSKDEKSSVKWIRNIYSECFNAGKPYEANNPEFQGCYINYPDVDMKYVNYDNGIVDKNWLSLYYGAEISTRLIKTKAATDPENIFRHEMSIPIST